MDYKTKSISRNKIRRIAKLFREEFHECLSKDKLYFDVIRCFEIINFKYPNVTTEICDDEELGDNPGRCIPDFKGNYHIKIKNSVYEGAKNGTGGYRTHIIHEISHAFLCMLGYTPILDREFNNKELRPFESMEWQAKALAGEILMDYELTKGLNILQLEIYCGVSIDGAIFRATH